MYAHICRQKTLEKKIVPFLVVKYGLVYSCVEFGSARCVTAMENWGCITFRETALLFEEGSSTESNKQRICLTTCHELAHMWFGNLVT